MPTFQVDEAPVPTGDARRNVLPQGLDLPENRDPKVSALRAGGARFARRTRRLELQMKGLLFSANSKPWTKTIRP
eukprot:5956535-Alexandrium_andersonii.AAC.1